MGYKHYANVQSVGPGGIKCPCCSPIAAAPDKWKKMGRRRKRRVEKFNLKQELNYEHS